MLVVAVAGYISTNEPFSAVTKTGRLPVPELSATAILVPGTLRRRARYGNTGRADCRDEKTNDSTVHLCDPPRCTVPPRAPTLAIVPPALHTGTYAISKGVQLANHFG